MLPFAYPCPIKFEVYWNNWETGGPELSKIYDSLLETPRIGHCQRWIPEVDQSFKIHYPSAEDGHGFLWNIQFKNVSVVEQFYIIFEIRVL